MARFRPLVENSGGVERLQAGDLLEFGKLNLGLAVTLSITSSAITISRSYHAIMSAVAGAQLTTINGGQEGDFLVLRLAAGSVAISVRDNTGNLRIAGNFSLSHPTDTITLFFDGLNWLEITRSNNG